MYLHFNAGKLRKVTCSGLKAFRAVANKLRKLVKVTVYPAGGWLPTLFMALRLYLVSGGCPLLHPGDQPSGRQDIYRNLGGLRVVAPEGSCR